MEPINWSDPKSKISKYFTVHEATWLPSWGKHHIPNAMEQAMILKLADRLDKVRERIGKPLIVHVWIRPLEYNKLIGGAPQSAHITGEAVDFHSEVDCDNTRTQLLDKLQEFGLRMENKPGSSWVHLDCRETSGNRFFLP